MVAVLTPCGYRGQMQDGKIKGKNSWIEGCWNIQRRATEPLPGLVLGTGFEDFFDSTCVNHQAVTCRHVLVWEVAIMIVQLVLLLRRRMELD